MNIGSQNWTNFPPNKRDVGMVFGDVVGDLAPQARAVEHVGLVDGGDLALARRGQAEGELDDAAYLEIVVLEGVDGALAAWGLFAAALTEVEAPGQLTNDDEVDVREALRLEG